MSKQDALREMREASVAGTKPAASMYVSKADYDKLAKLLEDRNQQIKTMGVRLAELEKGLEIAQLRDQKNIPEPPKEDLPVGPTSAPCPVCVARRATKAAELQRYRDRKSKAKGLKFK